MWTANVERWLLRFLLIVLLAGLAIIYIRFARSPDSAAPVGVVQPAQPPKVIERVIERIKHVKVPGPQRIIYLDREALAAKLKMPELAHAPDNAVVLAVGSVPPHRASTTVISELAPTGEGRLTFRPESPPLFEVKKEFGMRGGFGTGGLVVGEVYLRPLAINPRDRGQANVELRAFIRRSNSDGTDFGGAVLLDYRF